MKYSLELLKETDNILKELFPICRSITGNGVRKTLSILNSITDFEIKEIPSGTKVYDWEIPNEWNIEDAYVENSSGKKVIDFKKNNLHVLNYSIPFNGKVSFNELKEHLYTLPDLPNAIPYRTSYYTKRWGFCLAHNELKKFDENDVYYVNIKSTLKPGNLTYGEYFVKGNSDKEILFSTYCCHPSLANDNLSGMVLWILMLRELKNKKPNYSYRFVIAPETIGAIAYLAGNKQNVKNICAGFIFTCVAGSGKFSYKSSYLENHTIDKIVHKRMKKSRINYSLYPFDINGSDERQFSSPAFRIPIGTICKDKYYEYDNYHTSLDDLDFITSEYLLQTFEIYKKIFSDIEMLDPINMTNEKTILLNNKKKGALISLCPYGEPFLSKKGLYTTLGGRYLQPAHDLKKNHEKRLYKDEIKQFLGRDLSVILWILFHADGTKTIKDISKITHIDEISLEKMIKVLIEMKLVRIIK